MSGFERNLGKRLSEYGNPVSSRGRSKKGKNINWESSDSDNNDFENYAQALEKDLGGSSSDDDFTLKLEAHIGGSSSPKASANPSELPAWQNTGQAVKDTSYFAQYSSTRETKPAEQLILEDNAIIEKVKQIDIEKCGLITSQCHILHKKFEKGTAKSQMYYAMYRNGIYLSKYANKLNNKIREKMIKETRNLHSNLITCQEDFSKYINKEDFSGTNLWRSSLEDAKNAREYFINYFNPQ